MLALLQDFVDFFRLYLFLPLCGALFFEGLKQLRRYLERRARGRRLRKLIVPTDVMPVCSPGDGFYEGELHAKLNQEAGVPRRFILSPTSREHDFVFNRDTSLVDLIELPGMSDLPERIEKQRRIMAQQLNPTADGKPFFNALKLGVYSIQETRSASQRAEISMSLYETDYFTHRVMRGLYQEFSLGQQHALLPNVHSLFVSARDKVRPFLTSFGIAALVLCPSSTGRGRDLIVVRRSNRVHSEAGQLNLAMNEGLNSADLVGNRVAVGSWLRRGFSEELGIEAAVINEAMSIEYSDLYLVRTRMELGLISCVEFDVPWSQVLRSSGRDETLEIDDAPIRVRFEAQELRQLLDGKLGSITPDLRFAVTQRAAREGINLNQ